jgi:hypothetical protein
MNDDDVITAVREQRDKVHSHTPLEQIISRGRVVRTRRRVPGLAGALAVVAAAALAVTALAAPGHQQRPPTAAQLVAWTVVKLPDGDIRVSIVKLQHPAALQRKLRAEGVPASVVTSPPGPCRQYPASSALLHQVFPGSYQPGPPPPPTVIVIRPSALPSGTGVQLAGSFQRSPREVAVAAPILVYASPQCTGS